MKKIYNISLLALLSLIWVGCENDDAAPNRALAETTNGAVLRTFEVESGVFNFFDTTSEFSVTFGEQDAEDGDLMQSVDVFVTLQKRTPAGSFQDAGSEVLLRTISASEFSIDEFGLPRTNLTASLDQVLATLGITTNDFVGGDRIQFRLLLNLTDGRTFTVGDAAGNVESSSFFRSPYRYFATVACIPLNPVAGEYTFDLLDNFGDGWDGAFLTVTIDGVSQDITVTTDQGDVAVHVFNVPVGTEEFTIEYTAGSFEGEHEYKILLDGEEIFSDGPGPGVGLVTLSICP
ncbi:hypothetical protein U1E44_07330 [Arenibacter sp. GZD96]|uniref:hypothetical protein n=1 Tax=Aurantibrevibacter litoralis TaxID=3106030 RepID=UPI002AFDFE2E|nr:hypothetical protein [Arenibacter sp. GZD-96]MEA1785898.1 hypothetical protein [Arenibacter sp. GZD-96]